MKEQEKTERKIKVSYYFPKSEGVTFDFDYFEASHMPLVIKLQKPFGLLSIEIENGLAGGTPESPIPNIAVATLIFKSMKLLLQSGGVAEELTADLKNFTKIKPIIQVSEILKFKEA